MTERLRDRAQSFSVRVVHHEWGRPRLSEMFAMGIARTQRALIRETELTCDGQTHIYARSIFPPWSMQGPFRELRYLGEKPLIDLLKKDPLRLRGDFQIAVLTARHLDYQKAARVIEHLPQKLWARRSLFLLHKKPILVSEIFLPCLYE